MTIGQRIKHALDMRDMKQKELAKAINTTEVSISRYVNNERTPKATEIIKICKALHISSDWLLGLKEQEQ